MPVQSPATIDQEAIQEHIPALRRYARALTRDPDRAEDLVQDSVTRALSRLHKYRPGTNLRTWLLTILHNIHCDDCRREQRRGAHVPIDEWMPAVQTSGDQARAIQLRDFRRVFESLEPQDRQILVMVGWADYSYEEASQALDVAVGTVKSRLFRARRRLRDAQEAMSRAPPLDKPGREPRHVDA